MRQWGREPQDHIFVRSSKSAISAIHYSKQTLFHGLFLNIKSYCFFMPISMMIWLGALIIEDQLRATVFILIQILSLGVSRSKLPCLNLVSRLNIEC